MKDTGEKGKAAREAMAKLSGTDLAGFETQLKTTFMYYTPKDASRPSCSGAGAAEDHGSRARLLLRTQPARRERQVKGRDRHRRCRPSTLGSAKNVKLRFDPSYMKMAADGKL